MIRLILCALCLWMPLWAAKLDVQVRAKNALLVNADTGAVLYDKGAQEVVYPASTTKLATALFLLEQKQVPLDREVTVSRKALPAETDGSSMGLVRGEVVSVDALLHGLMLVSGNDAANVLAETASGSVEKFVHELNLYVRELGCRNTQFFNPHGYHHPEHVTSAQDLALVARKVLQNPVLKDIVCKPSYTKPKTNKQPSSELVQTNALLKPGKHFYPKAIGLKTGRTGAAGNNLVAAATHEGRTLIAVVLGCETNAERFVDAKRLFEAAFAETAVARVVVAEGSQYKTAVAGASGELEARLKQNLVVQYFPAEEPKLKAYLAWDPVQLPVQKGQRVGEVRAVDERGVVVGVKAVVAVNDVSPTLCFRISSWWNGLFGK